MLRTLRRVFLSLATLAVLVGLAISVGWWAIHTSWFADLVRDRIVAELERSTGGRVELGVFSYNPDRLHVRISKLVIHGNEQAGTAPLLSIASADIGLKILSLWRRDVDVESIVIDKPEVHLTVNANGSTNLPTPKIRSKDPIEQLLDLKVRQIEVTHGVVQVNDEPMPFAFVSKDTGLRLEYERAGPSYNVGFNANAVSSSLVKMPVRSTHLSSKLRIFEDHADIQDFQIQTEDKVSSVALTGKVEHFAEPSFHAKLTAALATDELAQFGGINEELQSGKIAVSGELDFDGKLRQFQFQGNANARGVAFVSPAFTLRGIDATSSLVSNNAGMVLRHVQATARGAHFSGEGTIKNYQFLEVNGQIAQVSLKEVGTFLTKQPFPWSGTAHGLAHASAKLGAAQPDFIIGAQVDLDAGESGIATSGNVDVTYYDRLRKVEFGNCSLKLPHTTGSFQGTLDSDLYLKADSNSLADLVPLLPILGARIPGDELPQFVAGGGGHFDGDLHDLVQAAVIRGQLSMSKFKFRNYEYATLDSDFSLTSSRFSAAEFRLQENGANLTGSAEAELMNWMANENSQVRLKARFDSVDVVKTMALITNDPLPVIQGVASGALEFTGSLDNPHGSSSFHVLNLDAFGEQLNEIQMSAALDGNRLRLSNGKVQSGQATLSFSGVYQHNRDDWSTGDVDVKADTNGFPLSSLSTIRKYLPALNGRAELHLETAGKLRSTSFEPLKMNGSAQIENVSISHRAFGDISLHASTQGNAIDFKYSGDLRDTKFHGAAQAHLTPGTPIQGDVQLDRISLAMAKSLVSDTKLTLPLDGFVDGNITFDGALEDPARMHVRTTIKDLEISSLAHPATATAPAVPAVALNNKEPIVLDVADGALNIAKFEIDGRDTSVKITGSAPFRGGKPMNVKAVGDANLALFMLFDSNVRSSGNTELAATVTGSLNDPNITGTLKVRNGSFFFADIPNGLSDVDGTVEFTQKRATIQKMTAHSGGGDISLGGSLTFGEGSPLVYHLESSARNVRVRYANSISVTANSNLRLSGTSVNSALSGSLSVTRVVFTPNTDAGNLLAAASASVSTPANPEDFISGVHLDVGVESAPNLQVSTNLSRDLEAEIQLRLRGTLDHPIVLGGITANQGDIKIFGTRFSLNRGEVSFVNSVKVEPVLDLDLETQARGVTVDITVSGTPSKLNFNYRSDPPLQPRDIIALLTVGRAPDVGSTSNAQGASDVSALTSGVNSVLGSAISPVSNRLSKLFGVTNIRIDPFVQGITNTPQARLSVEQQISRDVTVTYITNLSQTSEQIFRFEWALNRQFSIVALRDDNGEFGIDFQYKKRFK